MTEPQPSPAADNPLTRATQMYADRFDQAKTAQERRKALKGYIPWAAATLSEGIVRVWIVKGILLLSLLVTAFALSSGHLAWAIPGSALGVAGIYIMLTMGQRNWSLGKQWITILSALLADCVFLAIYGWLG